ncbi:MAG TPA: hypothetical protein VK191_11935 [Symbiobacteriaceae bacterium]|nr:hypothetical protein [Symbiobacteriaceae bacterium]
MKDEQVRRWTILFLTLTGLALAVYAAIHVCAWLRQGEELIRPVPAAWAPPAVQSAARHMYGHPGAYVMWEGEASWLLLSLGTGDSGLSLAGARRGHDGLLTLYLRRSVGGERVLILEGRRTVDWSQSRVQVDGAAWPLPWWNDSLPD